MKLALVGEVIYYGTVVASNDMNWSMAGLKGLFKSSQFNIAPLTLFPI